jgi:2-(1,2-epoxy-1,2-dihydrophenyl)acetyl-CoA isomerase
MSTSEEIDTGSPHLRHWRNGGVAIVSFDDAESRNALGYDLRPIFRRTIDAIALDDEVRCLLLTGEGNAFCAGGNAKAMATSEQPPLEGRVRRIQWESEVVAVLHEMPKPTVAALPGAAAGAGFSLALACDLRIASEQAFLLTAFKRIGLPGDFGGSWLLTQLVGPAKARELYFLSPRVQADEALALGLVNRVVPHGELRSEALAWAHALAEGPPVAYRLMKENLNRSQEGSLRECIAEEALRQCWAGETADFKEATRAFVEKRKPKFEGR